MEKNLTKIENKIYHYVDGVKVGGVHSYIRGNVSDIRGDVSDISGNVDDCKITDEDRQKGIDISELIK